MGDERKSYSTTGLPVIPYTLTTKINGIEYETHILTNTCQVITEDGLLLCDVLDNLVTNDQLKEALGGFNTSEPTYRYKGTLVNKPDLPAITQLYNKLGNQDGDVYVVQCSSSNKNDVTNRYDMYCWADMINQWVFFGTTDKTSLVSPDSEIITLFPSKLGQPGQVLTVSGSGGSLEWTFPDASFDEAMDGHNHDLTAHPEIWDALSAKADKLRIFNRTLSKENWAWLGESNCYSYVFEDESIPPHSYFELTPIAMTNDELEVLKAASIRPFYKIEDSETCSYTILNAEHVPSTDIEVCVKVFGSFIEE